MGVAPCSWENSTKFPCQDATSLKGGQIMAEMTTMTMPRTRQGVRDLDQVRGAVIPFSGGPAPGVGSGRNMGQLDRVACGVGGAALLLFGLTRGTLPGFAL